MIYFGINYVNNTPMKTLIFALISGLIFASCGSKTREVTLKVECMGCDIYYSLDYHYGDTTVQSTGTNGPEWEKTVEVSKGDSVFLMAVGGDKGHIRTEILSGKTQIIEAHKEVHSDGDFESIYVAAKIH